MQQLLRPAGVFVEYEVGCAQDVRRTWTQVAQIADRRGDEPQRPGWQARIRLVTRRLAHSSMLPGLARRRQALVATVLLAWLCVAPPAQAQIQTANAARRDDIASAESLAHAGQHAEAARLYESGAKRLFGWDTRVALLAARE